MNRNFRREMKISHSLDRCFLQEDTQMKKTLNIFPMWLFLCLTALGQTTADKFNEPWKDVSRPLVIDAYGKNKIDWNQLSKEPRVAAVIHKASECEWNKMKKRCIRVGRDELYDKRKAEAKKHGYLWGSYHLGRPGVGAVEQADEYLAIAQPAADEITALDLEGVGEKDMSLKDAEIFIRRVKEKTGRYPLLYGTAGVVQAINKSYGPQSVFAQVPLWYARYCISIECYFSDETLWQSYTLWQFASEVNCPSKANRKDEKCRPGKCPPNKCPLAKPISGTAFDMDVNVFDGTVEELKRFWTAGPN